MAITYKEIINIKELLNLYLSIPDYQRPYKWSRKSINQLFNDILDARVQGVVILDEHITKKL